MLTYLKIKFVKLQNFMYIARLIWQKKFSQSFYSWVRCFYCKKEAAWTCPKWEKRSLAPFARPAPLAFYLPPPITPRQGNTGILGSTSRNLVQIEYGDENTDHSNNASRHYL